MQAVGPLDRLRGALRNAGLRRGGTWLVAALVVLPLCALLALQYRALVQLEATSAAAQRMALRSFARAVLDDVESAYRGKADALDVSPARLARERLPELGALLSERTEGGAGVKRFFAVPLDANGDGEVQPFDGAGELLPPRPESPEGRAIRFALAPWRLAAREPAQPGARHAAVDEQDPEHPVLLRPLVEAGRVAGVVGLVADPEFLRSALLPPLVERHGAELPDPLRGNVAVTLQDRDGRPVGEAAAGLTPTEELAPRFRFVFTDWRMSVGYRADTPEQSARLGFWINLSLSLLATSALVAAIALALRSTARATRLSRMQTEFVSNASHELRTPLASLRVFGELLALGRVSEPAKIREYGEHIESESGRLERLVDNVLDFARIESAERRYRFEKADLREVVEDTLRSFEVRLAQEGFALELRSRVAALPPVMADPDALGQALANLLENAIKYSPDSRAIEVELDAAGGAVSVAVRDHGAGIPAEDLDRIFEKFYRVGSGLVHDARGSGLGLAIVKHVVEAHGGTVSVASRLGEGSTFTLRLPAHDG